MCWKLQAPGKAHFPRFQERQIRLEAKLGGILALLVGWPSPNHVACCSRDRRCFLRGGHDLTQGAVLRVMVYLAANGTRSDR